MGAQPTGSKTAFAAALQLGVTAEADPLCVLGAFQLPGVAVPQPVVGLLHLMAVLDALAEHAVLVTQSVAYHR